MLKTQVVNWPLDEEKSEEKQEEEAGYMLARDRTRRESQHKHYNSKVCSRQQE